MGRAIVLFACLFAAAIVAAYTHFSERDAAAPVYTVRAPHRPAEPAVATPKLPLAAPPSPRATPTPGDRTSLTRELQRELRRVGCYSGEVNGVWTTSSRMAMKSFTDSVNASLPIDNPDHVLLSLLQGHQNMACNASCPGGLTTGENGQCTPSNVQAKVAPTATPETKAEQPADRSSITTGSIVPASAAAATALTAGAALSKVEQQARPEDKARPASAPASSNDSTTRNERPEKSARYSGQVPSERVHERRSRRSSNPNQPPKFVRNLLKAFGIN